MAGNDRSIQFILDFAIKGLQELHGASKNVKDIEGAIASLVAQQEKLNKPRRPQRQGVVISKEQAAEEARLIDGLIAKIHALQAAQQRMRSNVNSAPAQYGPPKPPSYNYVNGFLQPDKLTGQLRVRDNLTPGQARSAYDIAEGFKAIGGAAQRKQYYGSTGINNQEAEAIEATIRGSKVITELLRKQEQQAEREALQAKRTADAKEKARVATRKATKTQDARATANATSADEALARIRSNSGSTSDYSTVNKYGNDQAKREAERAKEVFKEDEKRKKQEKTDADRRTKVEEGLRLARQLSVASAEDRALILTQLPKYKGAVSKYGRPDEVLEFNTTAANFKPAGGRGGSGGGPPGPPHPPGGGGGFGNFFNSLGSTSKNVAGIASYSLGRLGVPIYTATAAGATFAGVSAVRGALDEFGSMESRKAFLTGTLNASTTYFNRSTGKTLSGVDSYIAAKDNSGKLYETIRKKALESPLNTQELFDYAAVGLPFTLKRGLNQDQSLNIINSLGSLGKLLNLRPQSTRQDIRAIGTGANYQNLETFQALNIDRRDIKAMQKMRGPELAAFFDKKIKPYEQVLKEYDSTYYGKISLFQDKTARLGIKAGEQLAPAAIKGIESLMTSIDKLSASGAIDKLTEMITKLIGIATNAVDFVAGNADKIVGILPYAVAGKGLVGAGSAVLGGLGALQKGRLDSAFGALGTGATELDKANYMAATSGITGGSIIGGGLSKFGGVLGTSSAVAGGAAIAAIVGLTAAILDIKKYVSSNGQSPGIFTGIHGDQYIDQDSAGLRNWKTGTPGANKIAQQMAYMTASKAMGGIMNVRSSGYYDRLKVSEAEQLKLSGGVNPNAAAEYRDSFLRSYSPYRSFLRKYSDAPDNLLRDGGGNFAPAGNYNEFLNRQFSGLTPSQIKEKYGFEAQYGKVIGVTGAGGRGAPVLNREITGYTPTGDSPDYLSQDRFNKMFQDWSKVSASATAEMEKQMGQSFIDAISKVTDKVVQSIDYVFIEPIKQSVAGFIGTLATLDIRKNQNQFDQSVASEDFSMAMKAKRWQQAKGDIGRFRSLASVEGGISNQIAQENYRKGLMELANSGRGTETELVTYGSGDQFLRRAQSGALTTEERAMLNTAGAGNRAGIYSGAVSNSKLSLSNLKAFAKAQGMHITDVDTPGVHQDNSTHYDARAIDVRTRGVDKGVVDRWMLAASKAGYRVVDERVVNTKKRTAEHLHLEIPKFNSTRYGKSVSAPKGSAASVGIATDTTMASQAEIDNFNLITGGNLKEMDPVKIKLYNEMFKKDLSVAKAIREGGKPITSLEDMVGPDGKTLPKYAGLQKNYEADLTRVNSIRKPLDNINRYIASANDATRQTDARATLEAQLRKELAGSGLTEAQKTREIAKMARERLLGMAQQGNDVSKYNMDTRILRLGSNQDDMSMTALKQSKIWKLNSDYTHGDMFGITQPLREYYAYKGIPVSEAQLLKEAQRTPEGKAAGYRLRAGEAQARRELFDIQTRRSATLSGLNAPYVDAYSNGFTMSAQEQFNLSNKLVNKQIADTQIGAGADVLNMLAFGPSYGGSTRLLDARNRIRDIAAGKAHAADEFNLRNLLQKNRFSSEAKMGSLEDYAGTNSSAVLIQGMQSILGGTPGSMEDFFAKQGGSYKGFTFDNVTKGGKMTEFLDSLPEAIKDLTLSIKTLTAKYDEQVRKADYLNTVSQDYLTTGAFPSSSSMVMESLNTKFNEGSIGMSPLDKAKFKSKLLNDPKMRAAMESARYSEKLTGGISAAGMALAGRKDIFGAFAGAVGSDYITDPLKLALMTKEQRNLFASATGVNINSKQQAGLAAAGIAASYIPGAIFNPDKTYSGEGSAIGGMLGPSLLAGLGPWGAAVGALGGGLLGGLFKKKDSTHDAETKQWQEKVAGYLSQIDRSLRPMPDFFHSFRRDQILGTASKYLSGRVYNTLTAQLINGK